MKYLLTSLILLVVLVSCQKELTEEIFNQPVVDSINPPKTGNFTATIDSMSWVADSGYAEVVTDTATGLEGVLIYGVGRDTSIGIFVERFQLGTVSLNDTATFSGAGLQDNTGDYSSDDAVTPFVSTITISSIDPVRKTMSGTFTFRAFADTGTASRTVTNGKFTDIPVRRNGGVIKAAITDTFHVTADSALFRPYGILAGEVNNTTMAIGVADSLGTKGMNLNFAYNITAGTYVFDTTTLSRFNYYYNGADTFYMSPAKPGTLEVLENDTGLKRIRANFNFTGFKASGDSIKLTQGYFSVKYP